MAGAETGEIPYPLGQCQRMRKRMVSRRASRWNVGRPRHRRQGDIVVHADKEQALAVLRYPEIRRPQDGRLILGCIARMSQRRSDPLRVADPVHAADTGNILDQNGPRPELAREPAHMGGRGVFAGRQ